MEELDFCQFQSLTFVNFYNLYLHQIMRSFFLQVYKRCRKHTTYSKDMVEQMLNMKRSLVCNCWETADQPLLSLDKPIDCLVALSSYGRKLSLPSKDVCLYTPEEWGLLQIYLNVIHSRRFSDNFWFHQKEIYYEARIMLKID